jgi:hypothetical protein
VIRITIVPRAEAVPWQSKLDLIERIIRDDAEVQEPRAQPSCLGVELALYDGRPNFSVSCSTKSKAASGRLKIHPLSGRPPRAATPCAKIRYGKHCSGQRPM